MLFLTLYLVCVFVVVGTGLLASLSDFRGLVIPNIFSGIVLGAFFLCYLIVWLGGYSDVFAPLASHIIAALAVFGVTLVMFLLKGLGAADSKLGTAYALWVGLEGLLPFLFYMALTGGLLALAALFLKKFKPIKGLSGDGWMARVQAGENKVPYGIAIVIGALASFVKLGYFNVEVLSSFLAS
jgi:prepilin peptidase CpaA